MYQKLSIKNRKFTYFNIILIIYLCIISTTSNSQNYSPPSKLPSQMALVDYEKLLYEWIMHFNYKKLGWQADQSVRDTGPLSVSVVLYNQSIPPYRLNHRFTEAPNGIATQRLYYMASHLDLAGTPMENWKLKLVSDEKTVPFHP